MFTPTRYADLVVLGGGPGGYVAAIRASQLGKKVVLVEKADLGGICLNWGCIPTKALLASANALHTFNRAGIYGLSAQGISFDYPAVVQRSRMVADRLAKGVAHLMKKNRVEVLYGHGRLVDPTHLVVDLNQGGTEVVESSHVILATGARTRDFPGMRIDGIRVMGSRHALVLKEVPKSLAVIGGGSIGLEFAHHFSEFGAEVSIFEMQPGLLPTADEEVVKELERSFKKRKIKVLTSARIDSVVADADGVTLTYTRKETSETLRVDYVLVAVGVAANVEEIGLETVGIPLTNGFIAINSKCQTQVPNIYAIGDVAGAPCLAHKASAEGILAAEHIAGIEVHPIDPMNIPACTYCHPQVASVGLSEAQAIKAGYQVSVGRFPFRASGKAIAMDETEGMVKVILDASCGKVLGCFIVGAEATEILQEMVLARQMEIPAKAVLNAIHPHPTLTESLMEALGDALGEGINT